MELRNEVRRNAKNPIFKGINGNKLLTFSSGLLVAFVALLLALFPAGRAQAATTTINICAQNATNGWNLLSGQHTYLRQKLDNPANFGPAGTYGDFDFNYIDVGTSFTEATLVSNACHIWFSGFEDDVTYTPTELTELSSWVANTNGQVFAGCDHSSYDPVCDLLDFAVTNDTDSYGFVVQQVINPITCDGALDPSDQLEMSGGAGAYFTGPGVTSTNVIAVHETGGVADPNKPIAVYTGDFFLTSDIDMVSIYTLTSGGGVTNNNDIMAVNAFSALADVSIGNPICSSAGPTGTITIIKDADPEDDTPFAFTENIPGAANGFTLTDSTDNTETFSNVPIGSYTVTESDVTGWTLDSITCVDPDDGTTTDGATATIDLDDDETVTCTFTNTYDSPPASGNLYLSGRTAGTTGNGVAFGPEDILAWDGSGWSLWFDGTAANLQNNGKAKHNLNAIWLVNPGVGPDAPVTNTRDVVMSFGQNSRHVPGITGKVDGMDLVWYDGDANTFSLWFDGNDVDLNNKTQEKIDALQVLPGDGPCLYNILISTQGPGRVSNAGEPAIIFSGEDVLSFCATNLGDNTAGFWSLLLDGSAEGMPRNSTTSISVSEDGNTMYLTTRATFNVDSATGGHSMIYAYDFATEAFSGPYFIAADHGFPRHVNALHVTGLPD